MYHHPFGYQAMEKMIAESVSLLNKKCPVEPKFRTKKLEFAM
jgi:hypothetical protein